MFSVHRHPQNPLISPNTERPWESLATFNWCPIREDGITHVVYRAMSESDVVDGQRLSLSVIGYAQSRDSVNYSCQRIFISPEHEWEKFGCEDPRITKIDGVYYIFYTALSVFPFSAPGIKVAVAVTRDLSQKPEKHLVTPFNSKAMTLFPQRINGKLAALLTVDSDNPPSKLAIAYFDKPEDIWSEEYWKDWKQNLGDNVVDAERGPDEQVEIGAPPVLTDRGWLLVYSHIQSYHGDKKVFGIEALLLDLEDPRIILGRTRGPMLVPEESYEEFGQVRNITFPSGAYIEDGVLHIFYGVSDTYCAEATVNLEVLLDALMPEVEAFARFGDSPLLSPTKNRFEELAVFNPAALRVEDVTHIFYRAMSTDNTSYVGYASSRDNITIDTRLDGPIYVPRIPYEMKNIENGNSGCEDPRVTLMGDRVYMFYTAYNGTNTPRVAATSIALDDLKKKNWNWAPPCLITDPRLDDKDACLFPEKIDGSYAVMHRVYSHVCLDYIPSLDFCENTLGTSTPIFGPRPGMWDAERIGIAAPPIRTDAGWLLLYHGFAPDKIYRLGAALLDLDNPHIVKARTADFIFEPKRWFEREGIVKNVIFPCGLVQDGDRLFIYYGGADKYVGVAEGSLREIMKMLG